LYDPEVPFKISQILHQPKFIIVLRNPVDRAYSHYKSALQSSEISNSTSFKQALKTNTSIYEKSLYAEQIERYFHFFSKDQFLILILEQAVKNFDSTIEQIANFLEIDSSLFSFEHGIGNKKVGYSTLPKYARLFAWSKKITKFLRNRGYDWVDGLVNIAKKLQVKNFLKKGKFLPDLDNKTRIEILRIYSAEIDRLEKLINMDLSIWKEDLQRKDSKS